MHRWIRPLLTPFVLLVLAAPVGLYVDVTVPPSQWPVLALGVYAVLALHAAVTSWAVSRFLAGLKAAGLRYERVLDRIGWLGDRLVRLETRDGPWGLTCSLHRSGIDLDVCPPGTSEPLTFRHRFYRRGQAEGRRWATDAPSEDWAAAKAAEMKRQATESENTRRRGEADSATRQAQTQAGRRRTAWGLAGGLLAASGAHIVLSLIPSTSATPVVLLGVFTNLAGGVLGGLLAALLVYTHGRAWPQEQGPLDRWPIALGLVAGLGGFAAGVSLTGAAPIALHQPPALPVFALPMAAGVAAALLAWQSTHLDRTRGKALASAGVWLACLAGVHLAAVGGHPYLGSLLVLGGIVTLYLAWRQANELIAH